MDNELEDLKRNLRSKSFALDDVIPLARSAALAIEHLQADKARLQSELARARHCEDQLKQLADTLSRLAEEKTRCVQPCAGYAAVVESLSAALAPVPSAP